MAGFRRAISQQKAQHVLEIGCGPWAPLVTQLEKHPTSEMVEDRSQQAISIHFFHLFRLNSYEGRRTYRKRCDTWQVELSLQIADRVTAVEASMAHAQMAQQQMAHYGDRVKVTGNRLMIEND